MKNEKNKTVENKAAKPLHWGNHNPKLTDKNFIDRKQQASNAENEPAVDLSKEEPGRNRKGVREGESSLAEDSKKGIKK